MTSDDGLANNASQDDTQGLQERLDKEGMVVLGPGKFYISAPLRINRNKGLIGSGMDQTVIIAKDPNLSMFIYDPEGNTRAVSLANLTLQGGGVGVHLRGTEVKPNISKAFLSHITFRNMSTAGVYVDIPGSDTASPENSLPANCQSMDNNLISFCNFIQCAAGLKQRKPPQMGRYGFIDKLVVYRCQFLQCGIGIDFPATRPNNLCTYIECHFAGCTKAAARFVNNFTPTFANCDFTGCGGDPLVDSELPVNFMSCHFASNTTAKALLPPQSVAEGCSFESSPSSTTTVLGTPIRNDFYNCSVDLPLGPLKDGLFMNSRVADQQDLSQVMVQVVAGKHITLVKGAVAPCPQFLVTGTSDPTH